MSLCGPRSMWVLLLLLHRSQLQLMLLLSEVILMVIFESLLHQREQLVMIATFLEVVVAVLEDDYFTVCEGLTGAGRLR